VASYGIAPVIGFMSDALAIGIDLGATKIASALVNARGEVLATRHVATEAANGSAHVLKRIADEINQLIGQAKGDVLGIGAGSPGIVNSIEGTVTGAVNLHWLDTIPLVSHVRSMLKRDLPIWIAKDTNASVLGERYFGSARNSDNFAYLSIGSGFGAGVIANGQLIEGSHWVATDMGHLSLDPDGETCICGGKGCAEVHHSGAGLLRLTHKHLAARQLVTQVENSPDLTTTQVVAAAAANDALALAAIADMGRDLGIIMSMCANIFDPDMIIVGGGLGLAIADQLLPAAEHELRRRLSPFMRPYVRVEKSTLASSAVGAACLVWHHRKTSISQKKSAD
jgi:glucokinase